MPTLEFKGKQFVYSHHLSVPFRELKVDGGKSLPAEGQKPSLDDKLIIHGDNLDVIRTLSTSKIRLLNFFLTKFFSFFIHESYFLGAPPICPTSRHGFSALLLLSYPSCPSFHEKQFESISCTLSIAETFCSCSI